MNSSRSKTLSAAAVWAVVSAVAPLTVSAQLLYTNGVPDNQNGLIVNNGFTSANDFSVATPTSLTSFDWYFLRRGSAGPSTIFGNFSWEILANSAGEPSGSALATGSVSNASASKTSFACCIGQGHLYDTYLFSGISFNSLSLGPGTYWLGLGGFSETSHSPYTGYWASSVGHSGNEAWEFHDGSWFTFQMEGSYNIYGTAQNAVPEPGSIALLATGLIVLVPAFRRKLKI